MTKRMRRDLSGGGGQVPELCRKQGMSDTRFAVDHLAFSTVLAAYRAATFPRQALLSTLESAVAKAFMGD
ncbi:hypothetical protein SAMN05216412_10367 [Nitrosospira multiformis]|uniref:Uncharacterized protein n=1 Tax=Nitrosospira multiformis TaxID=1231 RepID=A0A1I0BLN4_9PROT|nr:hypothetical protein [Nitrosospira multiformis]SET07866.1 hypothetical protein SAMN05216412_10367 [Nitrosospira multiformis]